MLPNFLVIGAPKCGTTSLHHYLRRHPDVYMPPRKELHFFSSEAWSQRLGWYESRFEAAPVRGEASTSYTMHPYVPGVPERISSLVPKAKLVYILRDPIERVVAHYVEWLSLGFERRPLREAVGMLEESNPYICSSLYASQLEAYLAFFPMEQILVLDQADLLERRESTLAEVFDFLGVDSGYSSPEFRRVMNPRADKVALNRVGRWMARKRTLRRGVLRPLLASDVQPWKGLNHLVSRPASTPVLGQWASERLRECFSHDVARLRQRTGKEFSTWSV